MKNGERNRIKEKVKGREGREDERVKMRKGKAERKKQKGKTQNIKANTKITYENYEFDYIPGAPCSVYEDMAKALNKEKESTITKIAIKNFGSIKEEVIIKF